MNTAVACLLLATALVAPATAQEAEVEAPITSSAAAVAVHLILKDADVDQGAIYRALSEEFGVPVVEATGEFGLFLQVTERKLQATYRDEDGEVIERQMDLPQDVDRQLDTIALLSGNLARDEAGEILKSLQAEADVPVPPPIAPEDAAEEEPETPPGDERKSDDSSKQTPDDDPEAPKKDETDGSQAKDEPEPPAPLKNTRPALERAVLSGALWGDVSFPTGLRNKKTDVHLGAVHSEIGSLEGFAGNLLILKNRGVGQNYAGSGAQATILWSHTGGYFSGFNGSALMATGEGGIEGMQAAGIFAYQKNETDGVQAAGIASVSMSHIEGGQGAGILSGTWGDVKGGQGAGAVAITTGDLEGVQLAGGAAIVGGKMDGFQLAAGTWAGDLDGFQLGVANVAHGGVDGFQLGAANYAGDLHGTQIGVVNIGGKVRGGQFGLLNIAKDVDGIAFAPINIVPKIRNQIVTYGSWSPASTTEAAPAGPLVHLGLKFMPDPFYTQISVGLGAEAEECPSGLLPGDAGCVGNGVIYAPGFAAGLRGRIVAGLFTEIDLQYQFETAFGASSAHRHAVLGRAALGYEFDEKFSFFAGGGPRMDVLVSDDGTVEPLVGWNPHVFAGIQVL